MDRVCDNLKLPKISYIYVTIGEFESLKNVINDFIVNNDNQLIIINSGTKEYYNSVNTYLKSFSSYNIKHRYIYESHLTFSVLKILGIQYCDSKNIININN